MDVPHLLEGFEFEPTTCNEPGFQIQTLVLKTVAISQCFWVTPVNFRH